MKASQQLPLDFSERPATPARKNVKGKVSKTSTILPPPMPKPRKLSKAAQKAEEAARLQAEQEERDKLWAEALARMWISIKIGVALRAEEKAREMLEWEEAERRDPTRGPPPPLDAQPGDAVRLTAERLASTYGYPPKKPGRRLIQVPRDKLTNEAAAAASDARWLVVACDCDLCSRGGHLAVEGGRHFARAAVERVEPPVAGPVDKRSEDAMYAQLGMRRDDDGRWFLRRLG